MLARSAVLELLNTKPFRVLPASKQLTLALGGLYIASTSLAAKAQLVWETEKGYPRYYVPVNSLHSDVRASLEGKASSSSVSIKADEVVNGAAAKAVAEEVTVGSRSMSWVRFLEGSLQGLIRFERDEIGTYLPRPLPNDKADGLSQTSGSKMASCSQASGTHTNESTQQQSPTTSWSKSTAKSWPRPMSLLSYMRPIWTRRTTFLRRASRNGEPLRTVTCAPHVRTRARHSKFPLFSDYHRGAMADTVLGTCRSR